MAGLSGLLDLGASALLAYDSGTATVGRNLANVNTAGYARETLALSSELASPLVGGVRAGNPERIGDARLAARERLADGARGRADALASATTDLERRLTDGDALPGRLSALFSGFLALQGAPTDTTLRGEVVGRAESLAKTFGQAAGAIEAAQGDADQRLVDRATEATRLAGQIAKLNHAIATSADPVLVDQREQAGRQLASLTGADARIDADGMMRVTVGGGESIVDGTRASTFAAVRDPARGGHVRVDVVDGSHTRDVTSLVGGAMGADVTFRDQTAATAAADLDQLAFDLASQVNAAHRAGAGLDGVSGRDLFVAPAAVAGAARALAVDPTVAADPRTLAAGAAGAGPGDATVAASIGALASATAAAGGTRTFQDEGIRVIGDVGVAARDATQTAEVEATRSDALAQIRDGLSGVSTEDELARLSQLQHAVESTTRFLSTVDGLLDHLIRTL